MFWGSPIMPWMLIGRRIWHSIPNWRQCFLTHLVGSSGRATDAQVHTQCIFVVYPFALAGGATLLRHRDGSAPEHPSRENLSLSTAACYRSVLDLDPDWIHSSLDLHINRSGANSSVNSARPSQHVSKLEFTCDMQSRVMHDAELLST